MLLTLLYRRKWVGMTAFCFAALIGFSRIYVGVHWPFDVLAGAVFGMIVGCAVYGAYSFVKAKYARTSSKKALHDGNRPHTEDFVSSEKMYS
jgi:undecaprenyl-diphosphatase